MKIQQVTIQAHIHHGDYNEKIKATGETIFECISSLAKINAYVREPDWNENTKKLVNELEATGKGAFGWANYEVIKTESETEQADSKKSWIAYLQSNYSSLAEWESYCETYGLSARLGFDDATTAWHANPLIGGSTNPADFGLVTLDDFTRGYIACALWSSNDESTQSGGEPMDKNYSIDDISPGTLGEMINDCAAFQSDNAELLARADYPRNDSTNAAHAGHDFWLSRNGHGAGFWDGDLEDELGRALTEAAKKFKQCDLYVGDDGKIYA